MFETDSMNDVLSEFDSLDDQWDLLITLKSWTTSNRQWFVL